LTVSDSNGTDFLAGFLLGAVAGAALALLFAPQTGEQTRESLKSQSIELKGKAEEATARAREQAQDVSARGRIVLEERVAQLEEAMAEGRKTADRTRRELLNKLDEARGQAASRSTNET
jgi:gas vesicle protein